MAAPSVDDVDGEESEPHAAEGGNDEGHADGRTHLHLVETLLTARPPTVPQRSDRSQLFQRVDDHGRSTVVSGRHLSLARGWGVAAAAVAAPADAGIDRVGTTIGRREDALETEGRVTGDVIVDHLVILDVSRVLDLHQRGESPSLAQHDQVSISPNLVVAGGLSAGSQGHHVGRRSSDVIAVEDRLTDVGRWSQRRGRRMATVAEWSPLLLRDAATGGCPASLAAVVATALHPQPKHAEDADVQREGDEEGNEEGPAGREEDVAWSLEQDALVDVAGFVVDVVLGEVVPAEQRWNGDDGGDQPNDDDVEGSLLGRPLVPVPHGVECGGEAVEGDHAQVPDGRGAVEDVGDEPEVAHEPTEHPVSQTLVDGRQRKYGCRQQEVADGQVSDQIVRYGT